MQTTKDLQKDIASALRSAKESALGGDGDSDRAKLIKTDKDENLVDRFLGKDAKTAADKDQASDPLKAVHDHKDGEKDAKGEHKEGEKAETKTKAQDDLLAKNGRDAKADKDDPLGWKSFWERVEDKTDARHMLGNNADQTAAKTNHRITSYNVCYTKLLRSCRVRRLVPLPRFLLMPLWSWSMMRCWSEYLSVLASGRGCGLALAVVCSVVLPSTWRVSVLSSTRSQKLFQPRGSSLSRNNFV